MTWVRFSLILGMALALGSSHGSLMAQNPLPPDIEADRLLLRARKAYAKKDWKRAAASFAESQRRGVKRSGSADRISSYSRDVSSVPIAT